MERWKWEKYFKKEAFRNELLTSSCRCPLRAVSIPVRAVVTVFNPNLICVPEVLERAIERDRYVGCRILPPGRTSGWKDWGCLWRVCVCVCFILLRLICLQDKDAWNVKETELKASEISRLGKEKNVEELFHVFAYPCAGNLKKAALTGTEQFGCRLKG